MSDMGDRFAATCSHASHGAPSGLRPTGFDQAQEDIRELANRVRDSQSIPEDGRVEVDAESLFALLVAAHDHAS